MALNNRKKVNEYECEYSSEISSSSPYLNRLAVLSAHLQDANVSSHQILERFQTLSSEDKSHNSLTVIDNRTGKRYDIPISQGGTIKATDFKQVPTSI